MKEFKGIEGTTAEIRDHYKDVLDCQSPREMLLQKPGTRFAPTPVDTQLKRIKSAGIGRIEMLVLTDKRQLDIAIEFAAITD